MSLLSFVELCHFLSLFLLHSCERGFPFTFPPTNDRYYSKAIVYSIFIISSVLTRLLFMLLFYCSGTSADAGYHVVSVFEATWTEKQKNVLRAV